MIAPIVAPITLAPLQVVETEAARVRTAAAKASARVVLRVVGASTARLKMRLPDPTPFRLLLAHVLLLISRKRCFAFRKT